MEILPPRLSGPLSECSKSANFSNAIPGATVFLLRTRNGVTDRVGDVVAKQSTGVVALHGGEEFVAGDLVSAYQETAQATSPPQPDAIAVQNSEAKFNPPQVLTHLYQCSRGFQLGAMRPGTMVEIRNGATVIATGEATNGVAYLKTDEFGLPMAGAVLTARQLICPKPPPPPPSTAWAVDSQLPAVEPLLTSVPIGGTLPAPIIVSGLTACSRSVQVKDIIPGAEVIIEEVHQGWWAWLGPSDNTTGTVILPVMLTEGEHVEIRQEVGRKCEMQSERKEHTVGPREALSKPSLWQIDCNASPVVYIQILKQEADLEFEVVFGGETKTYRTVATQSVGTFPAPPMPAGATVRVRQGECEHWSDWSDPQTAKALSEPVQTPEIIGKLVECQNHVPVKGIYPLSGMVRAVSNVLGTIAQIPVSGMFMSIPVAPSLIKDHDITVEHEICGTTTSSQRKRVEPLANPSMGEVKGPLYDGDTAVTVQNVTAGAYLELWDQTHRVTSGYAPFSDSGVVDVLFSGLPPLTGNQHIYSKYWHCGRYGRSEGKTVQFRKPVLSQLVPSTVNVGSGALTLNAKGSYFRSGAQVNLAGVGLLATTFISNTEVRAQMTAAQVASPHTVAVSVRNPDGQVTDTLQFTVKAVPPPPPPPPPPPAQGYSKVLLHNCSTNHRLVHIYKRDATSNTPWQFVTTLDHGYDEWGTCPVFGAEPYEITLVDTHLNHFVAVDPEMIGCVASGADPSTASPETLACRRLEFSVTGKSAGPAFPVIVS
jgi:hypothetical protein